MAELRVHVVMCHSGAGSKVIHGPYSGIADQLIPAVLGTVQKKRNHSYVSDLHRNASLSFYACMFCF